MATKPIKSEEVVEKDVFKNPIDSAEKFLVVLNAVEDQFKNVIKASEKLIKESEPTNAKDFKKLEENIAKVESATSALGDVQKERVKVQQVINENLKTQNATLADLQANLDSLKRQRVALNKAEKQGSVTAKEANEQRAELNVLVKVANKQLNEAQKEIVDLTKVEKKLNGEYAKQSKRLNDLRKKYKDLVLSEGKVTKESKKLQKQISKLDKELKEVDESAGQFQRNVGNYPETMANAANGILGVAAAVVSAKLSFDGVKGSLDDTAEGSENVREATSAIAGIFSQVSNVVAGTALDLFDYGKAVTESIQSGEGLVDSFKKTEGQFKRTAEATDDFVEKVKESIEGEVNLTDRIIAFEKALRPLEKRQVILNGLIEEQGIIASDATRTFEELQGAVLKGQSLQVENANISLLIAREELQIVKERIRIANLAGGAGVALLNAETEAINKLKGAEISLNNEILENEKELRQIKQDRLEKDLDILIDGFDNQKTINERIIANEKETLEARSKLLIRTNELANKSFREQKKVLEDLSKAGIDIDELLLLDATELQKQIRLLEQSEIIEGRTLEVVRERRVVLQDLSDAQQELNSNLQDALDIEKDIAAQRIALEGGTTKDLEELEKTREANNIENLQRRLALSKEGSIDALSIQQELNDALLDQQESFLEKEEKKRQDAIDKQIKDTELAIEVISEIISKRTSDRVDAIDEEIQKEQERIAQLQILANAGNEEAAQSLAFEQKREAELALEKERLLRQQEQQELALTAIEIYGQKVASGDQNPLGSTISDITLLKQFISTLPSFFVGSDDIGSVSNGLDGNGGRMIMAHDNEQIWSKGDRKDVGFRTRGEIKDIIGMHDGGLIDMSKYNEPQNKVVISDRSVNEEMLNTINKSLIDLPKKMPDHRMFFDDVNQIMTMITKDSTGINKVHKKFRS